MSSGWDLRQPAPPDQAQLEEIAHESDQHIHRRELTVLCRFSIPIWLCHLLELSLNVVSVFSLGHLGTNELAAASLSSMTANVTGYSILAGFISALDSILPGAYTSQPKMVGLYTQRMLVIVAYLVVPISAIWFNAERLLLLLGQDPIVASLAGQYLRILAIGLPGYAGFEVCRRYLQAQGLMHAPTIVLLVASPINAMLNWLFVWGPPTIRIGFIGAPLASVISMWLMFILGLLQCYIAPRIAWDGWSRLAFTGLKPIFQLGLAGTFAMCAEWWSWEIVGLVTSKLGTLALAAQSVLLVCSSITYQLPYAMSIAVAVRVGNLLGASQARHAKICSDMAMFLSLAAGVANSLFYLSIRDRLGGLFSEDQRVIDLVTAILPVMAAFQVMDGVCGITSGILRGTGRQSKGAVINLTGYYVIGIPIGLVLTFGPPQWGLSGLWWGLTIALTYASIFTYLIIKRTDWDEEVRKTHERMTVDETSGATKQHPESHVDIGREA
ncbi:MATE efflux family protein [Meira miltonrushii]|uniref:MATE efflux family protein n=1 Tax=Meira miltonrushii TaxID=1280837 RepID=A0A316V495_9BASI|nr:MATE efflux family protein [Meira miltonrushii]PWN32367.1 MATE efflux family protein [Meira miltonrushii]